MSAFSSASRYRNRAEQVTIGFFPDGGSSGGDVVLYRGRTKYHVDVNWLTGAVTTSGGSDEFARRRPAKGSA